MKHLATVLIALCCLSFFSCQQQRLFESDLLENNDFESGLNEPEGWWTGPSNLTTGWSQTESRKGKRSITIQNDALTSDFTFYAQEIDNFETGKRVSLNVWIKTEAIDGEGLSIVIRGDTDASSSQAEWFHTTQGRTYIGGTQNWTEYTLTADSAIPDDITLLTVYLVYLPNTTGQAFFDDVSLSYFE